MPTRFVRTKVIAKATVCRDVPPDYQKKYKKKYMPKKAATYHNVDLKVPDELAWAIMDMYPGNGLARAIMKIVRENVKIEDFVEKE